MTFLARASANLRVHSGGILTSQNWMVQAKTTGTSSRIQSTVSFAQCLAQISIQPVVDSVGKDCRGLLVVHTVNDPEIATTALTVLTQSQGRRRLARAREGIHSSLS